jgi:hypothetical protein
VHIPVTSGCYMAKEALAGIARALRDLLAR